MKSSARSKKSSNSASKSLNRQRLWSFLSLWALLALAMPQLLWACPMTGKVGSTPAQACPCAAQNPTAHHAASADVAAAHHCCERVPLPSSDTAGHSENGAVVSARSVSLLLQPFALPSTFLAASALELPAPAVTSALFPPTISPPLISQHTPSLHSGRAPPF